MFQRGKIEIKQPSFVLVQVVCLVLLLFIYGCYAEQQHVTLKSGIISLCPNIQPLLLFVELSACFFPSKKSFNYFN